MKLFEQIVKTVVNVVTLPVDVVKDIMTFGGDHIYGGDTYTEKKLDKIKEDVED